MEEKPKRMPDVDSAEPADDLKSSSEPIDEGAYRLMRRAGFLLFAVISLFLISYTVYRFFFEGQQGFYYYPFEKRVGLALFAAALLATSLERRITWLQPLFLLIYLPFAMLNNPDSLYSMGAFIIAIIELQLLGFFRTHTIKKMLLVFVYYAISIMLIGVSHRRFFLSILVPVLILSVLMAFILMVLSEKWQIVVIRPRQKFRLEDKGLTKREQAYLKDLLKGLTFKEIAFQYHVSESTVRNTFAHIYDKFGVEDKAALLSMLSEFDIID